MHVEQSRILAREPRRRDGGVTLREVPGAYHNMTEDMDGPMAGTPWIELGREALAFFTGHLAEPSQVPTE